MTETAKLIIGKELLQLRVGVYQLVLAFEEDVVLSIESSLRYSSPQGDCEWLPGNPASAAALTAYVGKNVMAAEAGASNDLRLWFSEDGECLVSGTSSVGEAYQLTYRGGVMVF